jgi:hypothetical protein
LMRISHRRIGLRITAGLLPALASAFLLSTIVEAAPPDGRVYEQASAANKNGVVFGAASGQGDLTGGQSSVVSRDGTRVQADALAAFGDGDPGGVLSNVPHLLERGNDGWRTRPLVPTILGPHGIPSGFGLEGPVGFTSDLSVLLYLSRYRFDPRDSDPTAAQDAHVLRVGASTDATELVSCPAPPGACFGPSPTDMLSAAAGVNALSADGTAGAAHRSMHARETGCDGSVSRSRRRSPRARHR